MAFDPTKPVQCRNGQPARIIATDRKDTGLPIVALYQANSGCEGVGFYSSKGFWSGTGGHALDLVNIPDVKIGWYNWAPEHQRFEWHTPWTSLDRARSHSKPDGVILQVTIEDGIPVAICKVE